MKDRTDKTSPDAPTEVLGREGFGPGPLCADEVCRYAERHYRHLFQLNPQPMWVFDLKTLGFLEVNDAAVRHYGYARTEFLSMTLKDIRPPEDVPLLMEIILKPGQDISEPPNTFRHRKKDGTLIHVEVKSHELTFGGVAAGLALVTDVTERLRAEEALRASEEQLRQSQRMEAVGRLAGGVAHDFNNLLTVVNGYSELALRRLEDGDPLRRSVEEIRRAGERAAHLTRQLLAFSRKQILQPKILDLNALVGESGKMLRRVIGEDVEIVLALRPDLWKVRADPAQLDQVLVNLAVNSRDAMPSGGTLSIATDNAVIGAEGARLADSTQVGPHVLLKISDTGCGMDDETLARIFEPFFTTKETGKGTGLGLSTVYGIVRQSGGFITVESEVGRGTTFSIYLPCAGEEAEREPRESDAEPEGLPRGAETILLVEDEEIVRKMTRNILEECGYEVLTASNGVEALKVCASHGGAIDLLLTDVVMPHMGGRRLAEHMKVSHPRTRVLYMSGYTDDAILRHGVLEETAAFMEKPFSPETLARKVREVLDA